MLSPKILEILKKWENKADNIIEILHDLQTEYNWLPPVILKEIAKEINVPLNRIYHLATFFEGFSLKERGKHTICVCTGTSCHVKGAPQLVESIERDFGIKDGETTKDKLFTLKTKACFGACGIAPAAFIGEDLYGDLTQAKMKRILKRYQDAEKKVAPAKESEEEVANA
jgi:NADH-quinone oxidoreductase subunit E